VTPPPLFPSCSSVTGSPAVTFSRDGGKTTVPVEQKLSGVAYTYGVAVLSAQTLLSAHNTTISLSTDAGCSWHTLGDVPFADPFPASITPASADRAWIWSDNRPNLARYAGGQIAMLKPPADVIGVGADRAVPTHVRVGGSDGTLWDSFDAGDTWQQISGARIEGTSLFYRAAFDPVNPNHIVIGTAVQGAFASFDGGKTWTHAAGAGQGFNIFNVVVSAADPNTVWAQGLDLGTSVKKIFLSRDGGRSFTGVVDEGNGITLVNGTVMAAHPTDPNVLYFVFGTYFQDYGTDLFRYDAAAKTLTLSHFGYNDIDAIAFSPLDANVMYFGLEVVQGH
jgi:photosystem II stability/assembly factor-like uncharacterized protein